MNHFSFRLLRIALLVETNNLLHEASPGLTVALASGPAVLQGLAAWRGDRVIARRAGLHTLPAQGVQLVLVGSHAGEEVGLLSSPGPQLPPLPLASEFLHGHFLIVYGGDNLSPQFGVAALED